MPVTYNKLSPQPDSTGDVARQNDPSATASSTQGTHAASAYVEIVTEKRPARERRILASVIIPQPVEQVWQVITDYEHLSDFVPSLTSSKLLPSAEGRIRLEQIGAQCFLKFKFCARVVLEMTENFPYELSFAMNEGDFKQFAGAWKLQPSADAQSTHLSYDLFVKPPLAMPIALIERHLCNNLTDNLLAIRQRALEIA
ncbi:MAG: SRPBCC family protein [Phormidesmis sp.]